VTINPDLTIPGHPNAFVIGDLASLVLEEGGRPLPGVAQVAIQEGRWAAANLVRTIAGETLQPFEYHDKGNMATIGRHRAIAEISGRQMTGFPAWIAWLFIHILYLIGFRNRLVVLVQWMWAYFTYQRGARLITVTGYQRESDQQ
jgi:NADH dehydrogenase